MTTIAINLTLFELVVFIVVACILGFAIYFYIKSRQSLQQTIEENKRLYFPTIKEEKTAALSQYNRQALETAFTKKRYEEAPVQKVVEPLAYSKKLKAGQADENLVYELKNTIAQQQQLLDTYLGKVEELESEGKEELRLENEELLESISRLEEALERKNTDIENLRQQNATAQKMAARIEEVFAEFEQLQEKMMHLEKQAGRANHLAIELEDTKGAYEAIHKDLARKQERLEEVMEDNHRLKDEMNMLEDKLSEANMQRQHLQKKVQFLTDLNNDMQNISDTNKKLQTELRRIGELESMLNMMSEERDFLLRKKNK